MTTRAEAQQVVDTALAGLTPLTGRGVEQRLRQCAFTLLANGFDKSEAGALIATVWGAALTEYKVDA